MTYAASFTAGALLHEETLRIVEHLPEAADLEAVDPDVLPINAAKSRQRKTGEILKRLESMPHQIWHDLPGLPKSEQNIVLFYGCLKAYRMVFDFQMDVVLQKWRALDRKLTPYDAERFLEKSEIDHPEVEEWSATTREKVRQVLLKMLTEVGILQGKKLQPVQAPDEFWERFIEVGDTWFLEAMLLNKQERDAITHALQ